VFDISVGSIVGFSGMLLAKLLHSGHFGSPAMTIAAVVVVLGICGLVGVINGTIVSTIGINALITTLSMLWVLLGLSLAISGGIDILIDNSLIVGFGTSRIAGIIPLPFFILLALYVMFFLLLKYSVFGRQVYIIGNNEKAAAYAGVPVRRVRIELFAIAAVLSGLAGIMLSAKLTSAQAVYGEGYPIGSIAICLLGGTLLSGGRGGVVGTFIALIFLSVLQNALDHIGLPFYVTNVVTGVMLVLAIVLSNLIDRPRRPETGRG
jgi:ribose transport system permease protein